MSKNTTVDFGELGLALVIIACIIVTYLNGHDDRQIKLHKIKACERTENVAQCIKETK